jgi:uncharacterized protein (TIGR00369 family)
MNDSARSRFDEVPINRHLGLHLVSRSDAEAIVELDVKPELLQEYGVVHGGILAVLADTAAVYVLHPSLNARQSMTSIEFKVNFLAAARPAREVLRAHASLVRRGRRIALCEVRVLQGDTEVMRGLFTYLISESTSS